MDFENVTKIEKNSFFVVEVIACGLVALNCLY